MAMQGTAVVYCDPCTYNKLTAPVQFWCLSCEEALCKLCADSHKGMKATRNHRIITYEKSKGVTSLGHLISQQCKQHNKLLDLYCPTHDEPVCSLCISKNHRECKDMVSIDDVAKNVISSTSYSNLQRDISNLEDNLAKVRTKRKQNLTNLENQESSIQASVKEMRRKFNEHLDKLEIDFLQQLGETAESCKTNIKTSLADLESRVSVAGDMNTNVSQLNEVTTDVQMFLAIREIEKLVQTEHDWLQESLRQNKMNELSLDLKMVPINIHSTFKSFGSVLISNKPSDVELVEPTEGSAQISIKQTNRNIEKLKLSEKTRTTSSYELKDKSHNDGCLIWSNGDLMIANEDRKMEVYSGCGQYKLEIPLPGIPCGMAEISKDCIAVTYGNGKKFEIASLEKYQYKTIKTIITTNTCWAIAYYDNKLAVKISASGINIYDVNGTLSKTLNTSVTMGFFYNITMMKNIYFSLSDNHTVHCCDQHGIVVWTYQNDNLKVPKGINTDCYGNVFVVGSASKNVFIISHDGQGRELLKMDQTPFSVSFDKVNNQLLVRTRETIILFDIDFEQ
ncbi:E3 ubiquitin-protein ligase TRIM56-like [Mytilus edulis]|uniref:E3 ubiquitin-protein ligase TRIM56-like n=1 Tax=Mytilus edulis TaxID=6550 RepID=UPI0039F0CD4C